MHKTISQFIDNITRSHSLKLFRSINFNKLPKKMRINFNRSTLIDTIMEGDLDLNSFVGNTRTYLSIKLKRLLVKNWENDLKHIQKLPTNF